MKLFKRSSVRRAILEAVEPRRLLASVSGTVYNDAKNVGFLHSDEAGLAGQTVYVDSNWNSQLDSGERFVLTDAAGRYTLADLPLTPFSLRLKPTGDYTQTVPRKDLGYYVGVQNGALVPSGTDFGVFVGVTFRGNVFLDANGNGVRDQGEAGSPAATLQLTYDDDPNFIRETTQAQADGTYVLYGERRNFTVKAFAVSGYVLTTPDEVKVSIVDGRVTFSGSTTLGVRPAVITPGTSTITGQLYEDLNKNGQRDAGEPAIQGGYVGLISSINNAGGASILSDGTFAIGNVSHTGPLTVNVRPNDPRPLIAINPQFGSTRQVTGVPYSVVSAGQFGYHDSGVFLRTFAFDDTNNNGVHDASDRLFSSGFFWLDTNNDNLHQENEQSTNHRLTLPEGTHRIAVMFPGNTSNVADASQLVTVSRANGSEATVNFLKTSTVAPPQNQVTLSVVVFNDRNGNGRRDSGEEGAGNATVFADYDYDGILDAGEPIAVAESDLSAYRLVADRKSFALRVIPPTGFTLTTPAVQYAAIVNGQFITSGTTFGVKSQAVASSVFSGIVYNDVDRDGVADAGETGAGAGHRIWADLDEDGTFDANEPFALTNADGRYTLSVPTVGTSISLRIQVSGGFINTGIGGRLYGLSGSPIVDTQANWFVSRPGGTREFGLSVYNDTNGNGRKDANEPGVAGQTIFADYNYNGVLDANEPFGITDNNGAVRINAEIRAFAAVLKTTGGYVQTTPSNNGVLWVAPNATNTGFNFSGYDFGVRATTPPPTPTTTTVSGKIYVDTNGNGQRDPGETQVPYGPAGSGFAPDRINYITLDINGDGLSDQGATISADGSFTFYNVPVGRTVRIMFSNWGESPLVSYTQTSPASFLPGLTIATPANGSPITNADIGYRQLGRLYVTPFVDSNKDGIRQGGTSFDGVSYNEVAAFYLLPQPPITFWIDLDSDGAYDTGEPFFFREGNDTGSNRPPPSPNEFGNQYVNLPYGTYTLAWGDYPGAGNPADGSTQFTLSADNRTLWLDIAIEGNGATQTGKVFNDANNNGIQDPGESGVANRRVFADYDYDGIWDADEPSALTNSSGIYTLTTERRGFALRLLSISSSVQTFPTEGRPHYFSVYGSEVFGSGRDFGTYAPPR